MANVLLDRLLFAPYADRDWHMTFAERAGLLFVLRCAAPAISIEIGTFRGGSLRPISDHSSKVFSFDIDPNQHRNISEFSNVEYITGDSSVLLPPLLDRLRDEQLDLGFVLIDGSHETAGVMRDINNCLQYKPQSRPVFILMHDSANPAVRQAILETKWSECPYFYALDIDFVPGIMHDREDIKGEIWGGLALAVLHPDPRPVDPEISSSFSYTLEKLAQLMDV